MKLVNKEEPTQQLEDWEVDLLALGHFQQKVEEPIHTQNTNQCMLKIKSFKLKKCKT